MNRPKITVLCEDKQHESFIRRLLRKRNRRVYAVQRANSGAADRFVIDKFPEYLDAVRKRGGILVTMIDGDNCGVSQRLKQLDESCSRSGVSPHTPEDKAIVIVPTRNIETWFTYLDGMEVNESDTYPKLRRERECKRHVDALVEMCEIQTLRTPSPPSLYVACQEYHRVFNR